MIVFNYKYSLQVPFGRQLIPIKIICGGTLINPRVVMTAGHCIPSSVVYSYYGYPMTLPVLPNAYYPTLESMLSVYSGVHDISFVLNGETPSPPGLLSTVSSINVVSILFI